MGSIGQAIADAAVGFLGTPFAHQGRQPGVGLDCAGVVLCASWAAGLQVADFAAYGRAPHPAVVRSELEARTARIDQPEPGDVALLQFESRTGIKAIHFGIWLGDDSMVHAMEPNRVRIVQLLGRWAARVAGFWRLAGAR